MNSHSQEQPISTGEKEKHEEREHYPWGPTIELGPIKAPLVVIALVMIGVLIGAVGTYLLVLRPDIIDPLIEIRVKETVAAQPTSTFTQTASAAITPSSTPAVIPTMASTPPPTPTATSSPTFTPTVTPTRTPSPTPSNLVKHFDSEALVAGWSDGLVLDDEIKHLQTIKGAAMLPSKQDERGVVYELQLYENRWVYYIIEYAEPIQADVIVAQFYLPDTPDIQENIVTVQVVGESLGPWIAKSFTSIPPGEWTQIILDLRGKNAPIGVPLNTRPLFVQVIFAVKGVAHCS